MLCVLQINRSIKYDPGALRKMVPNRLKGPRIFFKKIKKKKQKKNKKGNAQPTTNKTKKKEEPNKVKSKGRRNDGWHKNVPNKKKKAEKKT